ncbi:transcriptional regulator [Pseudomonas dryadis]|uniref:Transcriptional regulator n=1 Tax=Phytopseudomonas dryadis TaxID=2487520 RepID=A0ABY1ZBC4_9GAMM|nr:transcriptional regulator [Pseudomonas dryadis]TBV19563.1 transcriptional regulator [Pseudomonas sp. FRB 230]
MSDVYKALADGTRRTILDERLARDRQTLFELCGRLATRHGLTSSRQAVSQHLEVLQAAGLVIAVKEGRYKLHSIDTDHRPLAISRESRNNDVRTQGVWNFGDRRRPAGAAFRALARLSD